MKIYQIVLSKSEVEAVNSGKSLPKHRAYMEGMLRGEFEERNRDFYEHVANYKGNDLEGCFHSMNTWDDDKVEVVGRCHSLSVGDICVLQNGTAFMVAPMGFNQINFEEGENNAS